jgi:hypothetical protein
MADLFLAREWDVGNGRYAGSYPDGGFNYPVV